MQNNKQINDATYQLQGYLYQFYVALEYAFLLIEGQKMYIEKYGDITISKVSQIEVKKYQSPLTNTHENFWKTLKNWLDNNFDISLYKNLILLTTQTISTRSSLIDWNMKNETEKLAILNNIAHNFQNKKRKDNSKEDLIKFVLSGKNRTKLKEILSKFEIVSNRLMEETYFNSLKSKYASHLPEEFRTVYLENLLGFILSPSTVNHSWEINFDNFSKKQIHLTSIYCKDTKLFPFVKSHKESHYNYNEYDSYTFIHKIEEIKYKVVKKEAIKDYVETNKLIIQLMKNYDITKEQLDQYEENVMKLYKPNYRIACRNSDKTKIINKSKDFYDKIMSLPAPNFLHYNNTPSSFKNGTLHNLANDYSTEEEKYIQWLLKEEDDE